MVGSAVHYGLNVSDMDDALAFYEGTLGLEVDRRFPISDVQSDIVGVDGVDGDIAFLDAGGFSIELIAYDEPANENVHDEADGHDVGVAHLCLEVDDVWKRYETLEDEVEFINEPQTVGNGAQIAYLRDPDGNYVELMEPPADT
ncbi:VOC family protein [Natrarchaeobius oligotrophus]|uniref:VOC family protein n=1 Tax=Natrarchaeobius chitinivorans TaxID=1679083 RepID=A0A3N6MH75_NATCH|nr:VOC family protein [Natrarchaeobius chitinivorans]RQH02438.1 VOC family protein [Natrarchaeobius chitinivorans]